MKMYEDGILLDSVDISSVGNITTNSGLFFGMDINQFAQVILDENYPPRKLRGHQRKLRGRNGTGMTC